MLPGIPKRFKKLQKPERRSRVEKRAKRKRKLSRAQCRAVVFLREKSRCQRCGREVTDDCWPYLPQRAHVNEIVPKSHGGSPYDPDNCELLCNGGCHIFNGQHAPTPARLKKLKGLSRKQ